MGVSALLSPDDYAAAARALLPRGAVWSDDPQSEQGLTVGALARSLYRSDAAAQQLLVDAFPATTEALLDEWEATLGLPDPLVGAGDSDGERRAQIIARLIGAGGQSRARFIAFAASLGFTITIENFAPLRVGRFRAGDPAFARAWVDVWRVHITANTGSLSPAALKAELDTVRPAETTIILA